MDGMEEVDPDIWTPNDNTWSDLVRKCKSKPTMVGVPKFRDFPAKHT